MEIACQFLQPHSIATDAPRRLDVADRSTSRIQIIKAAVTFGERSQKYRSKEDAVPATLLGYRVRYLHRRTFLRRPSQPENATNPCSCNDKS